MVMYAKKINAPSDWGKLDKATVAQLALLDSDMFKAIVAGHTAFVAFELDDDDKKVLAMDKQTLADYGTWSEYLDALTNRAMDNKDLKEMKRLITDQAVIRAEFDSDIFSLKSSIFALEQGAYLSATLAYECTLTGKTGASDAPKDYVGHVFRTEHDDKTAFIAYSDDVGKWTAFVVMDGIPCFVFGHDVTGGLKVKVTPTKARQMLWVAMEKDHTPDIRNHVAAWFASGHTKLDSQGLGQGRKLFVDMGLTSKWLDLIGS